MPQIIYSQAAIQDLERLREFLKPKNPSAAQRAAKTIIQGIKALGELPYIGRPIDALPQDFRDWLIDFGHSGYIVRYRINTDTIVILAIRHQKEAGF